MFVLQYKWNMYLYVTDGELISEYWRWDYEKRSQKQTHGNGGKFGLDGRKKCFEKCMNWEMSGGKALQDSKISGVNDLTLDRHGPSNNATQN